MSSPPMRLVTRRLQPGLPSEGCAREEPIPTSAVDESPRVAYLALGYAIVLVAAALLTGVLPYPWLGLFVNGSVLLVLLYHTVLCWRQPFRYVALCFALAPASQVVLLLWGPAGLPTLYRYLSLGLPVLAAAGVGLAIARPAWVAGLLAVGLGVWVRGRSAAGHALGWSAAAFRRAVGVCQPVRARVRWLGVHRLAALSHRVGLFFVRMGGTVWGLPCRGAVTALVRRPPLRVPRLRCWRVAGTFAAGLGRSLSTMSLQRAVCLFGQAGALFSAFAARAVRKRAVRWASGLLALGLVCLPLFVGQAGAAMQAADRGPAVSDRIGTADGQGLGGASGVPSGVQFAPFPGPVVVQPLLLGEVGNAGGTNGSDGAELLGPLSELVVFKETLPSPTPPARPVAEAAGAALPIQPGPQGSEAGIVGGEILQDLRIRKAGEQEGTAARVASAPAALVAEEVRPMDCAAGGFGNVYPYGQCTWYVKEKRWDLPWFTGEAGHAMNWATSAQRCGFVVDQWPAVGAVAVFPQGDDWANRFGHVAYVEEVGDDYLVLSECNVACVEGYGEGYWWEGSWCRVRRVPFDQMDSRVQYIHGQRGK